uniref:Uncharacterized protein n=1 Tax=viral metagenome TaxID=1070528 RepID=A0A6C0HMN7_9ZZZZ
MALESDTAYNQLLKFFKKIYKKNLLSESYKNQNHINANELANAPSKYGEYIALIKKIFATKNESNNIPPPLLPQPLLTDNELFKKLYSQIIDYKTKSQTQQDTQINNDLFYINMHGGFNLKSGFKQIPPNIVVVFLTPVNRYGFACSKENTKATHDTFNNPVLKKKFLNNILCIDKINDNPKQNNRTVRSKFAFFENALVLLPGQYYCDLNLSFTEKDEKYSVEITHYGSPQKQIIPPDTLKYNNTLSNIIKNNIPQDKLTYVIVDCCRNLDHLKQNGTDIYIYENFMLYFNTIMSKCNAEAIKSTNLPVKEFSKFSIIAVRSSDEFVVLQETIEKSFVLYLNTIIKIVTTYIILKINTTDLQANLPENNFEANEFIKLNLLTNIKLIYDDTDKNQNIKIDKQIIYDFIIKLYNIKQIENDNYDRAFNYITELNTMGTNIQKITERKGEGQTVNTKEVIEEVKVNLVSIKEKISLLLALTYPDTDTETLKKIKNSISLKVANKQLSFDLSKYTPTIDLLYDLLYNLYPYLINSVQYDNLKKIIIKQKYSSLIDTINTYLNGNINNMIAIGFIKGKPFNTTASNTSLGHLGRKRLQHATYLLSRQLSELPPTTAILNGGRRTKRTKRTKRTTHGKKYSFHI